MERVTVYHYRCKLLDMRHLYKKMREAAEVQGRIGRFIGAVAIWFAVKGEEMKQVSSRAVETQEMAVQVDTESKRGKKRRVKGMWLRVLQQVQVRRSRDQQQVTVISFCVAARCFSCMGVRGNGVDAEVQVGTEERAVQEERREQSVQVGGGGPRIVSGPRIVGWAGSRGHRQVEESEGNGAERQEGTDVCGVLEANRGGCRVKVQCEKSEVEVRGEMQVVERQQGSNEEADVQLLAKLRELFVENRGLEMQEEARNTMEERMRNWPDYLPPIGR